MTLTLKTIPALRKDLLERIQLDERDEGKYSSFVHVANRLKVRVEVRLSFISGVHR